MKSLYLRAYVIDKTNAKQKPKKNPAFPSTEYITAQTSGESKDWKSFPELYTLVKLRFLQISSGTKCKFKSKVLSNNLCAHRRELCFPVRSNWPQTFFTHVSTIWLQEWSVPLTRLWWQQTGGAAGSPKGPSALSRVWRALRWAGFWDCTQRYKAVREAAKMVQGLEEKPLEEQLRAGTNLFTLRPVTGLKDMGWSWGRRCLGCILVKKFFPQRVLGPWNRVQPPGQGHNPRQCKDFGQCPQPHGETGGGVLRWPGGVHCNSGYCVSNRKTLVLKSSCIKYTEKLLNEGIICME